MMSKINNSYGEPDRVPDSVAVLWVGRHARYDGAKHEGKLSQMFNRKMKLMLSDEDVHILIERLINFRNEPLREGDSTDAVDDSILRLYR